MKRTLIWIFAIGLTITAAIYQRLSGPTYPMKTEVDTGKQKINLNFPRSHAGDTDCELILPVADIMVKGYMEYRKYPTKEEFQRVDFSRQGDRLIADLPLQPVAGKLEYRIFLEREGESISVNNGKSVVIRFRGDVPPQIIIPHILLMFLAMLFSNVAGLLALFNTPFKKMTLLTLITLFIGGLILGPLVQKYAFNELWTGVPFGWDLTDNKTLIAFIAWLVAWWFNRTDIRRPLWVVFAAIMTILIFSIPHSMFGSELDPESGKIIQGTILPYIATLLP
jgi:hypothetical protein